MTDQATTKAVTIDDLQQAEILIKRARGRVETRRAKLAEEETALRDEINKHAALVDQYGKQHCPGDGATA
jgi:outer membrane protein TolC